MSRMHTKDSRVFVNAAHLSGSLTGWGFTSRRSLSDVTCLGNDGDRFLPGQFGGGISLRGVFDSAPGDIQATLDAAAAVEGGLLTTILPEGFTVGRIAFLSRGNVTARAVDSAVKDAVRMNVDGQPDDGVDIGVVLHPPTPVAADGNGASVDNSAPSTNGVVASLHVTAFAGLTNNVVKVQHSPDDSVWTDLITFTTVTGTTWEYRAISGPVQRYLRAIRDVTGTGTTTYALSVARR